MRTSNGPKGVNRQDLVVVVNLGRGDDEGTCSFKDISQYLAGER